MTLSFDPTRPPATPRPAAAVILLRAREADGAAEVFLLRRRRGASFMASAFVFPGGGVDTGEEGDARLAAARELFEEAGVLLVREQVEPDRLAALRAEVAGGAPFAERLAAAGLTLDLERLLPFSHWITPSAEARRFSARFFVALLPPGQTPRFDAVETVDEAWVTPPDGLARAAELRLPPPQLRTLLDLAPLDSPEAALALARARAGHVAPIVPRFAALPDAPQGFALLLPWDAEYAALGQGEGEPLPADHPFAGGPSRFVLDADGVWHHR